MKLSYVTLVRLPTDRAHGYAIMKMCEQFAQSGASVELVAPDRHRGIKADPFEHHHIRPNFKLRKLWATDLVGKFEASRAAFAVDQATFILSLMLRKFTDEVVYTRDYQTVLFVSGHKIVLEIHAIPERSTLFLRALRRANKIVAISNGLKEALIALGVQASKIVVAPDSVDLSEFDAAPDRSLWSGYGVSPHKKIALYTGHFYGWKGGETLARTGTHVSSGTEIVLMGGVDRELADFKKLYANDRVHVIGFQPRKRLAQILISADVLILPNSAKPKISSHYTSPLKLFQYMASGVPIVSSDLPSIREILTDDMVFWFTPDDEHALAQRIEYVLSHPEEAHLKAARAREAVKKYTWGARAKSILKHIQSSS